MQNGQSTKKEAKKNAGEVIGREYRFHDGRGNVANIINDNKHITNDHTVGASNISTEILRNHPNTCQSFYLAPKHNSSIAQRTARKIRLATDHLGYNEKIVDFDLQSAVREKRKSLQENVWIKEVKF